MRRWMDGNAKKNTSHFMHPNLLHTYILYIHSFIHEYLHVNIWHLLFLKSTLNFNFK